MKNYSIARSRRLRSTPYTSRIEKQGVTAYTSYNHMLLPAAFGSLEDAYHHLKENVQVWDVAGERQVEISGKDSGKLVQLMTCRDLSKSKVGRCYYCPIIDDKAGLINDPVILKLGEERWWISIADSDVILFAKGLAIGNKFDVKIFEPNVDILAVQGPKSFKLMEKIFGKKITEMKFFGFEYFEYSEAKHLIARSGWSKQGGFEIYVEGFEYGMPLWNRLMAVGQEFNVKAGCPNLIERIEGGLLSYGNDVTREHSPFEAGLSKFVNSKDDYLGKAALEKRPWVQLIRPIQIEGEIPPCERHWPIFLSGERVGTVTSAVYSPDFGSNVAIGMVNREKVFPGLKVEVETQIGFRYATVRSKFWI